MAKTRQQIETALQQRYDGRTDTKNGMTYAAWEDIAYAANEAFSPLGYSQTFVSLPHLEGNGYACVLRLEVFFIDDDGTYRSVVKEGQGYNELSGSANEVDTAIKGCAADAFKKALSFMGDAFALYIGAEAKAAKAASKGNGYQRTSGKDSVVRPSSGSNGGWADKPANEDIGSGGLSQAQVNFAKKLGVTDEELETLTRGEVKAILDNKGRPGGQTQAQQRTATTAARVGTPSDDDDDIFA